MPEREPESDPRVQAFQIREINKKLDALSTDMEKGFDRLDSKFDERLESRDRRFDGHEGRLRSIEQKQAWWSGIAAVMGTAVGTLFGWLINRQPRSWAGRVVEGRHSAQNERKQSST
jgi:hypothetical protein